jgi:hypothetical protein
MDGPIASEEACMNAYALFVVAASALLLLVCIIAVDDIRKIRKRARRLSRLETKLDVLMKSAGIDPYIGLPAQVVDAICRGEKTKAIRLYRSATGGSLKEATDFIEEILRRSGG